MNELSLETVGSGDLDGKTQIGGHNDFAFPVQLKQE
jgi:hypothetical protein